MYQPRDHGRVVRIIRLVGAYALIVTAYYLLPLDRVTVHDAALRWGFFALIVLALAVLLTYEGRRAALGGASVTIDGLVFALALVVVIFAVVYVELARRGGEFAGLQTRTDGLYFTVSTLATVGFGDVHATGQAARIAVMIQILFDLVFVAAAAATLAGRLHGAAARHGTRSE